MYTPGRARYWGELALLGREIQQLIAEGESTKEIAYQLNVSSKIVETHHAANTERLRIHDAAGLVSLDRRGD